ncbi:variable large family protein [Borreliella lusitaniae]|uniref:variable large family protein n=1 Tax=Borreliella lusitaniae TaxID=100177 RepID=UPI003C7907F5
MVAAAREDAAGATGGAADAIAAVNAAAGAQQVAVAANGDSVKGIAKGMKGIVEAAGKLGVELAAGGAPAGVTNAAAGNLFAGNGANNADIENVGKAADAVSKVSGKQILKAIVDSADEAGAAPGAAASPIAAAIGGGAAGGNGGDAGAFTAGNGNMDRDDKIAAAIVLRGMAASGKFAHGADDGGNAGIKKGMKIAVESVDAARVGAAGATGGAADAIAAVAAAAGAQAAAAAGDASVKGIAKGMKGIVAVAGKLGVELAAAAVAGVTNAAAGNLFAGNAGTIAHVGKAADAVSKVSGKQILKAIVDSADEAGAQPDAARSPIAAAIGAGGAANAGAGGDFAAGGNMNRDDKIAAAIVLRGMAANGKFAHAEDNNGATGIKKGMKIAVRCCERGCCWCYWWCS